MRVMNQPCQPAVVYLECEAVLHLPEMWAILVLNLTRVLYFMPFVSPSDAFSAGTCFPWV